MQLYLDKSNHDITPLLMSLEGRTVIRMRTRVITRDVTFFSNSTEVMMIDIS